MWKIVNPVNSGSALKEENSPHPGINRVCLSGEIPAFILIGSVKKNLFCFQYCLP
jgi:hypothetical protein